MLNYILKRLFLVIPTLFLIITINFFIIQMAPGGPVERMLAKIEHVETSFEAYQMKSRAGQYYKDEMDSQMIEKLKTLYGFDKPIYERYLLMLKNYLCFNFGESYYRQIGVLELIKEKLPVSISLGLFSTLLIYLLGIPLGIYKAKNDGTRLDLVSSLIIVIANAIPAFLFGIVLIVLFAGGNYWDIFPLRGLISDDFESLSFWNKVKDYLWHIALPVFCISFSGLATLVFLVKNSFLDEMHKAYVLYAKIRGVNEDRILYSHIFRNAMLLVISSFPSVFLGMFFSGSLLIEVIFSLDGLGLLGYDSLLTRDYPVVFGSLYIFTLLGLLATLISDLIYVWIDPRIHFEKN